VRRASVAVGHRPQQRLQEGVLTALGRSRIALNRSARSGWERSSSRKRCARRGSASRRSRSSATCASTAARNFARPAAGGSLFCDPRPRADYLRQRPLGNAPAVGQAAALIPPALLLDAVEVLEELPQQARHAHAGVADDRDEPARDARGAVLRGGNEASSRG